MKFSVLAVLMLAVAFPLSSIAGERGFLGFSIAIDGEGFFLNPTLKSITITNVALASPAALAGIKAGDEIVEVAGQVVAGTKAKQIQALAEREVGQSLALKVKRSGGDNIALVLIAVEKPVSK